MGLLLKVADICLGVKEPEVIREGVRMGEQQMPAFAGQGLSPGHVPQGKVSLSGSEAPSGNISPGTPADGLLTVSLRAGNRLALGNSTSLRFPSLLCISRQELGLFQGHTQGNQ